MTPFLVAVLPASKAYPRPEPFGANFGTAAMSFNFTWFLKNVFLRFRVADEAELSAFSKISVFGSVGS